MPGNDKRKASTSGDSDNDTQEVEVIEPTTSSQEAAANLELTFTPKRIKIEKEETTPKGHCSGRLNYPFSPAASLANSPINSPRTVSNPIFSVLYIVISKFRRI